MTSAVRRNIYMYFEIKTIFRQHPRHGVSLVSWSHLSRRSLTNEPGTHEIVEVITGITGDVRRYGIDRENRLCLKYNSRSIGDELHYIIECQFLLLKIESN
jgi:hypothetical protein